MFDKFNPLARGEPLDIFLPSFRADTFRDMDDIVRNMLSAFNTPPAETDESVSHQSVTSVDVTEDSKKFGIHLRRITWLRR